METSKIVELQIKKYNLHYFSLYQTINPMEKPVRGQKENSETLSKKEIHKKHPYGH